MRSSSEHRIGQPVICCLLGLDRGHGRVDILRHATVKHAENHVLAVLRIALREHERQLRVDMVTPATKHCSRCACLAEEGVESMKNHRWSCCWASGSLTEYHARGSKSPICAKQNTGLVHVDADGVTRCRSMSIRKSIPWDRRPMAIDVDPMKAGH